LEFSVTHGARFPENLDTSGFNRAIAAVTPLVDARLTELANGSLEDFVTQDGTLTRGNSRATDVQAAAERVGAATALFNGYVALGLPQALATDDKLHGVVAGEASDALLHPYFDSRSAVPAATVPGQVANYLKFVKGSAGDPIDALGIHFLHHRLFLEQTIRSYVVRGRALGQEPSDGGRLDESSPLVAATIDRLELTRAVLADHLSRPAPSGGTQPAGDPSPLPQSGSDPAAPGGTPAPAPRPAAASRARIVTAPRARAGAIRVTVSCLSGTCAVGASATAGGRTVGRAPALTLRAGAQRVVIVRLTSAGRRQLARHGRLRVTVRITLAGTTRPLAVTPLTLRR
jgi:hypothetical protein